MFPSFILSLREGLEAALVIGIVLGAVHKMGRPDLKPVVWAGAGMAVIASIAAAVLLTLIGAEFEGRAEEIFEGFAMLAAAGLLTWMIFWMHSRARTLKSDLEDDVRLASFRNGGRALFILAFLAISREGFELVLFLGAAGMASNTLQTLTGAVLGLGIAVFLGWLLFATTRRLNLRQFFRVTNVMLILFAAGLVAHGVHEFNEAGLIPPVIEHVWDTNPILDENATTGEILKALFGYNGNPSLTEVVAYLSYFVLLWLGIKLSAQAAQSRKLFTCKR
jgi:high-affinity iron transporter